MKIQERTGAGAGRSAAPAQPSVGDRLPTPPRERKPALAALAVLLILVGALGATMLVLQAGNRIEVIKVTAESIPAGESVEDGDVTSVMVAEDDTINYVRWEQLDALKKLKAKSTIHQGSVLVGNMFTEGDSVPAGKAAVGLALKEGQYPKDLESGHTVAAYRVGSTASGSGSDSDGDASDGGSGAGGVLVDSAEVRSVGTQSDSTVSTGTLVVNLVVDQADAAALAQAAAAGEVAIVHIPGNGN